MPSNFDFKSDNFPKGGIFGNQFINANIRFRITDTFRIKDLKAKSNRNINDKKFSENSSNKDIVTFDIRSSINE